MLTNIYILTYVKIIHKCAIALPELKGLAFYTFYTLTLLQMGVLRQYVVFMLPGNLTFPQLHDFFWSFFFFWSFLKEHSFTTNFLTAFWQILTLFCQKPSMGS